MTYSLNQTERNFIYKKYINLGCIPTEAYRNVKELNQALRYYSEKLRFQKLTEQEIKDKLKQKYYEKCQEIESKF